MARREPTTPPLGTDETIDFGFARAAKWYPDVPALEAQDMSQVNSKDRAAVFSVDGIGPAYYFYDPDSTDPADGVNIVAPNVGGGRWIRSTELRETGKKIDTIMDLEGDIPSFIETMFSAIPQRTALGYKSGRDGGGGGLVWDSGMSRQNHNAITVFSPTHSNSIYGDTQDPNWYTPDPADIGTGAWVRDVIELTPEMAGAVGDYDPNTDTGTNNAVSLGALFNLGIPVRGVEGANYLFTSQLLIEEDCILSGNADFYYRGTDIPAILVTGSLGTTEYVIDQDVVRNENYVVSSTLASQVSNGSLVIISSDKLFTTTGTLMEQAELKEVRNVDTGTNTIYFTSKNNDEYLVADNPVAQIVTPIEVDIDGLNLINVDPNFSKTNQRGIEIWYANRPRVRAKVRNFMEMAIRVLSCFAPVADCQADGVLADSLGYGIQIGGATTEGKFTGTYKGTRHAISVSGASRSILGIPHNNVIHDAIGSNNQPNAVFDCHPCGLTVWNDCTAIGGDITSLQGVTNDPRGLESSARELIVNNLTTIACGSSITRRNDGPTTERIVIDGLTLTRGDNVFSNNGSSTPLNKLSISNVRGDCRSASFILDYNTTEPIQRVDIDDVRLEGGIRGFNLSVDFAVEEEISISNYNQTANKDTNGDYIGLNGDPNYRGIHVASSIDVISKMKLDNVHFEGFHRGMRIHSPITELSMNDVVFKDNFEQVYFDFGSSATEADPVSMVEKLIVNGAEFTGSPVAVGAINATNDWNIFDEVLMSGIYTDTNTIFGRNGHAVDVVLSGIKAGDNFTGVNLNDSREGEVNVFGDINRFSSFGIESLSIANNSLEKYLGLITLTQQEANLRFSDYESTSGGLELEVIALNSSSAQAELGIFRRKFLCRITGGAGTFSVFEDEISTIGNIRDDNFNIGLIQEDGTDLIIPIQHGNDSGSNDYHIYIIAKGSGGMINLVSDNYSFDTPTTFTTNLDPAISTIESRTQFKGGITDTLLEVVAPATDPLWEDVQTALDDISARLSAGGL